MNAMPEHHFIFSDDHIEINMRDTVSQLISRTAKRYTS